MRRLAPGLVIFIALAGIAYSQGHAPARPDGSPSMAEKVDRTADEGHYEKWKWANFVILAGVLGWLIAKHAPAFFRSRTAEIQKGIADASRLRAEAEARAAQMESRMAALQSEIEQVRAVSKAEMAHEIERLGAETEKRLARLQVHGEQEIAAAAKHAQNDLRAYSAQLAIQIAEQRIRGRMTAGTQNALVDGFLRDLDEKAAASQSVRQ